MKSRKMRLIVSLLLSLGAPQAGWSFYNPSTGRWLSRDPIGEKGGVNLMAFVGNAPSIRVDGLGEQTTGNSECRYCGPDVTKQLKNVVAKIQQTFRNWDESQRKSACAALSSTKSDASIPGAPVWANAWDIKQLHDTSWMKQSVCGIPRDECGDTVMIEGQCFFAGSVNYVMFGVISRLCEFQKDSMLRAIDLYKGQIKVGPIERPPAGNWQPSRDWANAGYDGWAPANMPKGDRSKCNKKCPVDYHGADFSFHWSPFGDF